MPKLALALAWAVALVLPAVPAVAQDYTGNVNPGAWTSSMPMEASIRAQAKRQSSRQGGDGLSPYARQVCEEYPQTRARLGARDARVRKTAALCRQAGYRY